MSGPVEEQLRRLEDEATKQMHSNVHRFKEIVAEMMQLSEGAGPKARALALRAQGNSLRIQAHLPEALAVLEQATRLWRAAGDELEWARTQTALLPVFGQMGRHRQAVRASNAALAVFLRLNQVLPAARLLNNTATVYYHMGRMADALACFDRAAGLAALGGDANQSARINLNRAVIMQQMGQLTASVKACALALRHGLRTGQGLFVAKTLQAGAVALFLLGQFGKAIRRFSKARRLFETESVARDVAVCDLYIAACYLELNRHAQALGRARSVLEVMDWERSGFHMACARLYEGAALAGMGDRDGARLSLAEAGEWFEANGHAPWAGRTSLEQADLLLRCDDEKAAVAAATHARQLFRRAQMPVEEGRARLVRAEARLRAGRRADAARAATAALQAFEKAGAPHPAFQALHLLGRIAEARGDLQAAGDYLTRAIDTAERVRSSVQLPFRQAFLDDKASAYGRQVWLLLQQGEIDKAHELADRAKSRSLVDSLADFAHRPIGPVTPEDRRLIAEIEAIRRSYQELSDSHLLPPDEGLNARGGEAPEVRAERRAAVEARLAALWDEWELRRSASLGMSAPRRAGSLRVRNAARLLPAGACMVEYFVAGQHLVAFVSDRRGQRGWVDLGSPEPVRRALDYLQLNLDAVQASAPADPSAVRPGAVRNARALLSELHRHLWAPLLPLLGKCRQAVLIPHGFLHLVPFSALYDGNRYLVEHMELTLAPAREAWVRCTERGSRAEQHSRDLVMGYSVDGLLPYIDEEAVWVGRSLQVPAHVAGQASSVTLAQAGACRLLHLAVHGEFRPDNPHFSTLLLADGPFTAADAAALRLDAQLVVLSGCETGLSRITRGDELLGMISAFLQAGSAAVLASHWRVDDRATALLMQGFYTGLLAGLGKAAALREAQAALAVRDLHPLYWAAFGLIGHGGPMSAHKGGTVTHASQTYS